jgi:hypothetical protein
MADRRSKPRLSIDLGAEWESAAGKRTARITNLSEGGCFLDSVGDVRRGEIVGFRVLLPDDDWLYLEGEVRHHTAGEGFGVQFVDLNEEQVGKLIDLIRRASESDARGGISADLVEE